MQEADQVQSLVARCLADPGFLDVVRDATPADGDAGRARLLLGDETLGRLILFRGHVTRVQNNGLRRLIPSTLRLLERLDLDLPFFSAVSTSWVRARRSGPLGAEEHLDFIEARLSAYLEGSPHLQAVLDCLGHERALLARPTDPEAAPTAVHFRGWVRVRRYTFNPLAWCGARDWQAAPLPGRSPVFLLYWRVAPDAGTAVHPIDAATALLLSAVDGRRDLDALATHVAAASGGLFDPDAAREAYQELAQQGILDIESSRETRTPSTEPSLCASSS